MSEGWGVHPPEENSSHCSAAWVAVCRVRYLALPATSPATQDLCRALEGSPHCQHLDAVACASQLRGAAGSGSSNGADSNSSLSRAGSSSASAGGSADAPTPQPEQLLDSWCLQQDKEASGWGALSGAECMRQFRALRSEAVAAVRNGTGTLLFKHVHKVRWGVSQLLFYLTVQLDNEGIAFDVHS